MNTALFRAAALPSLLFLLASVSFAQHGTDTAATWRILPGGEYRMDLLANPEEPRTGVRFEPGTSQLRLDVGTGLDLFSFTPSPSHHFRMGIDLFAYALTTNNFGLRLQVDALDGFFGGHLGYRYAFGGHALLVRIRLLHRSAHFVDGHIDPATGEWKDGKEPVPFTRDFGEMVAGLDLPAGSAHVRVYAGVSYATLSRPPELERVGGLFGCEYRTVQLIPDLLGRVCNLYAGYHLGLDGTPAYVPRHSAEAGLRFGDWGDPGLRILVGYQSGPEIYGQYYDRKRSYWEIGFAVDGI